MKETIHIVAGAVLLFSAAVGSAKAEGDPKKGAEVYRACTACHSLEPDLHLTGPSLAGLWETKAASVQGFVRYSKALKAQDFVWNEITLNAWLADPNTFVAGNSMTFRGIDDEKARTDLIAFLKLAIAAGGTKSVIAKGLISKETARGQVPEPVDRAGAAEQVAVVRHCHNTFFVVTADGKERAFWEMNLRLKVDSSRIGPKGGKPVLAAGGMMGDRASIVFSDPTQISVFIQRKC